MIHGADGSVLFYRDFARQLKTDRAIYAIEAPSLSDDQWQIPDSVEELATEYVKAIRAVQPTGPYWIAGYSFGGVAAFEIASQLERAGEKIETIVMYDIPNPALTELNTLTQRVGMHWERKKSEGARMQERALSIVMRSLQSVRDRATFEFTNRLSQLKSNDTDSAIWRHLKTRQKHMHIEEFYVPQMVKGPIRIVSATGNGSKSVSYTHLTLPTTPYV